MSEGRDLSRAVPAPQDGPGAETALPPAGTHAPRPGVQAGDVLLYQGTGFWSRLIRIKTWSDVSHCELANSASSAFASRDGKGVGTYPVREAGLYAVLRPVVPLDMDGVRQFHARCLGQRYDWWGLLRFVTIGKQSQDKQFCSEYVVRLLRSGGIEPFTPQTDADLVAPGQFLMSPAFRCIWASIHESAL